MVSFGATVNGKSSLSTAAWEAGLRLIESRIINAAFLQFSRGSVYTRFRYLGLNKH
jgi:hypothetical protein